MLKRFMKGLLSMVLLVMTGVLSIIEIGIEVTYQLIRLIRRGYCRFTSALVKKIEPLYNGKIKLKVRHEEKTDDEIKIYEFTY